ncbi:MAG: hypothetical protein EOO26_01945 [Comamonadaceae bacterium]|nr:MAG: hypothetical protein EOO26_01945 [Comamonadaceae bacterium]
MQNITTHPRALAPAEGRAINTLIHRSAIHLLLLADLLFASRLYRIGDLAFMQPLLLGLCAGFVAFYFVFTLLRGYIAPAALLLFAVLLIFLQLFVFSGLAGVEVKLNAGFQFFWALTFVVFFLAIKDGHGVYLADALLLYASCYAIVYGVLALAFNAGLVGADALGILVAEDVERGQRLFSYTIASAYAWFGWLYRLRERRTWLACVMLAVIGLAIYLALSRVVTLCIVLMTFAALRGYTLNSIGKVCITLLLAISAISLYGVFDSRWNPFELFTSDTSGAFRMWEYDIARDLLREHFALGIGIAPSSEDSWQFVKQDFFAPSDLGVIGIWLDLGLAGLACFLAGSYIACRPGIRMEPVREAPLVLTGCLMAVYGCIAPVIFYPAGVTYFAVLLGFWLNARNPAGAAQDTR